MYEYTRAMGSELGDIWSWESNGRCQINGPRYRVLGGDRLCGGAEERETHGRNGGSLQEWRLFRFFFTVKTWWNHLIWSKIWGLTDIFWCSIMDDGCCDPRLRNGPGFGHRWFWAVLVHILVLAKWNHMFFQRQHATCLIPCHFYPFLLIHHEYHA